MIRSDQQTALDDLARDLHDARSIKGERITANTVLRVAIDGVIEYGDRLHGDNEVQLRDSWLEFLGRAAMAGPLERELDQIARELDQNAGRESEPITASTLIRIAIAGLAMHRTELRGATEEELLDSWLELLNAARAVKGRR